MTKENFDRRIKNSNSKQTKGITLIALIITIIILIILAMVTVKLAIDGGILKNAEFAASMYIVEQEKELLSLAYQDYKLTHISDKDGAYTYQNALDHEQANAEVIEETEEYWKVEFNDTYHQYIVDKETGKMEELGKEEIDEDKLLANQDELKPGDYVNYEPGENYTYTSTMDSAYETPTEYTFTSNNDIKWRVLRKDGDNIVLISDEPIMDDNGNGYKAYGPYAWYMIPTEINNICEIYGHGKNAVSAKSIDLKEICETLACNYEDTIKDTTYYYRGFTFEQIEYNRDTNYYYDTIKTDSNGNIIEKSNYKAMDLNGNSGLSAGNIPSISAFAYASTDGVTWVRMGHHPERLVHKYTYGKSSYQYLVNNDLKTTDTWTVHEYNFDKLNAAITSIRNDMSEGKENQLVENYKALFCNSEAEYLPNFYLANTSAGYGTYRLYRNNMYFSSGGKNIGSSNIAYGDSWGGLAGTAGVRPIVVLKGNTQIADIEKDENGAWNLK